MADDIFGNNRVLDDHEHDGRGYSKPDPKNFKGYPVFTTVPTHKAEEGTMILFDNGTTEAIYTMLDGTWVSYSSDSSGSKVGSLVRTAATGTGTLAITGVGFTPSSVEIYAYAAGAVNYSNSLGWASSPTNRTVAERYDNSGWTHSISSSLIVNVRGGGNTTAADLDSMDSDGFTLDFTTMGVTCALQWKATK